MECSTPGCSVHGVFQARTLEWVAMPCPPPGDLLDPGIEPISPALIGRFSTTVLKSRFLFYVWWGEESTSSSQPGPGCSVGHTQSGAVGRGKEGVQKRVCGDVGLWCGAEKAVDVHPVAWLLKSKGKTNVGEWELSPFCLLKILSSLIWIYRANNFL